jgi:ankyrin repeat protein
MLLEAGTDKDETNYDSSTALMIAALNGRLECIEYFAQGWL